MSGTYEDVIRQLEDIRESLLDLSLVALHDAVESGANNRPASDKKLAQAMRAVEKAIDAVRAASTSTH